MFAVMYNLCIINLDCISYLFVCFIYAVCLLYIQGVPKKKKDILNIHIKSEGINIFSQKFCWTKSTIFVVKCQNFTFIVQLFMI